MSRAILIALSMLLLQAPAPARLTLQGRVVKQGTNDPVVRANIVLAKVGGELSDYRTVTADDGGKFAFRDLSAGTYRVYAEREGYVQTEYGQRTTGATGTPIVLTEGQVAPEIVIPLVPPGVITGRVMDRGKPARNVWVRVLKAAYRDGQRNFNMIDYAPTNDLGEYRVFGLPPGLYFVSATPASKPRIDGDFYVVSAIASNANNNQSQVRTPGASILAAGTLDPAAFDPDIFLSVYHPGTTDPAAATPIDLKPGMTMTGIDLSLMRASGVHVRGRVLNGVTGEPAQNISVVLSGGRASVPGSQSDVFDLAGVPPGEYTLIAQTTSLINRMFVATSITVADRDIENLTLTLMPGRRVTGRLMIEGRAPNDPAVARYLVQLMGTSGLPGYSASPVQADGTFTVENVSARDYRFRVLNLGTAGTPFIKAARFGPDNVLDAPIRVRSDNADRIVEIMVSLNTAVLDVQVVDGNQRPAPGVLVIAVPDSARRTRSELYRSATADRDGRIHLEGMIPGEYKLFASIDVEAAAWQDPDVIRLYESRGTPIRLAEGAKQEAVLRVLLERPHSCTVLVRRAAAVRGNC
jgi:5-hydroxyisourate hydrolase-like protein (transthyretin family)